MNAIIRRLFDPDATVVLPAVTDRAPYRGQHRRPRRKHAATSWRPAGWMPPVGARRIAALTEQTQEMEAISA